MRIEGFNKEAYRDSQRVRTGGSREDGPHPLHCFLHWARIVILYRTRIGVISLNRSDLPISKPQKFTLWLSKRPMPSRRKFAGVCMPVPKAQYALALMQEGHNPSVGPRDEM